MSVIVTETMILPIGCTTEEPNWDLFAVYVRWQNTLGWIVCTHFRDTRLSVKGRKWSNYVEKRNRRFYYFPTYGSAVSAASKAVDGLRVNGKTYKELKEEK